MLGTGDLAVIIEVLVAFLQLKVVSILFLRVTCPPRNAPRAVGFFSWDSNMATMLLSSQYVMYGLLNMRPEGEPRAMSAIHLENVWFIRPNLGKPGVTIS